MRRGTRPAGQGRPAPAGSLRRGARVGPSLAWGVAAALAVVTQAGAQEHTLPWRSQPPSASAGRALDPFWRSLGDPVLERLVALALDASPEVQGVEARVGGARAERVTALLDLAPTVTVSGGYTRQRLATAALPGLPGGADLPAQGLWEAGLQVAWEIDARGVVRNRVAERSALVRASREDGQDARRIIAAEVATAYYRLRGEQDRLAVARRNADNQRHTLDLTRERLEAGRGTALDTERAQAQLSSTLAIIAELEASVAVAGHRITRLVGRDASPLLPSEEPFPGLPELPGSLAAWDAREVVERRPDLRAEARRLEAAEALVGVARAAYLPRIHLQGAVGYTAGAFDALGSSGTPRYAVGPVVSWSFLDLGRVRAEADGARAAEAEARFRYEGAVLRAVEEVETSRVAYARALEGLHHLEGAAAASRRATDLARLRFQEGATDFLEVLDAERRLLEAEDRLADGRIDAVVALISAHRALAGAWPGS